MVDDNNNDSGNGGNEPLPPPPPVPGERPSPRPAYLKVLTGEGKPRVNAFRSDKRSDIEELVPPGEVEDKDLRFDAVFVENIRKAKDLLEEVKHTTAVLDLRREDDVLDILDDMVFVGHKHPDGAVTVSIQKTSDNMDAMRNWAAALNDMGEKALLAVMVHINNYDKEQLMGIGNTRSDIDIVKEASQLAIDTHTKLNELCRTVMSKYRELAAGKGPERS